MEVKRENRSDISYGTGGQPTRRRQEAPRRQAQEPPARHRQQSREPQAQRRQEAPRQQTRRRQPVSNQRSHREAMDDMGRSQRQQVQRSAPRYIEDDYEEFDSYEVRQQELERIRRNRARARKRRKQRQRMLILSGLAGCFLLALLCLLVQFAKQPQTRKTNAPVSVNESEISKPAKAYQGETIQGLPQSTFYTHPSWTEDFLSISEWARPGEELPEIKNIFVHYTANKNTSAAQNRSYFEGLKDSHERAASAHFIIGYEGEIIQCIPLDEIGYAVKTRNYDSVSIECCYQSNDGSFNKKTYDSLITLLKWLIQTYDLTSEDILRHYDCGGKKCPLYYTEHPDEWEQLKKDVADR
ncbi:MAG: N-acetylmuramoyl-L-alanine amidase [Clostridium sp.]|nr:N-acetylmuramoyl-L-alanine amidase [Clostridium sp.]